jgi:nitroreductase
MLGAGNQYRTRDSSALAVFITDLEPRKRIDRIHELERNHRHPEYSSSFPMISSFLLGEGHAATMIKGAATSFLSQVQPMPMIEPVQSWGYKNASLMAQTFCLAAESHGLATCMMEGFDGRRVAELLRIPDRYAVPLVIATGFDYEDRDDANKTPRLELSEVVFGETFGQPLEGLVQDEETQLMSAADKNVA